MAVAGVDIARAASMLDQLVQRADAIRGQKLPKLFGRDDAVNSITSDSASFVAAVRGVEQELASLDPTDPRIGGVAALIRGSAIELRRAFARVQELGPGALQHPPLAEAVEQVRVAVALLQTRSRMLDAPPTTEAATARLVGLLDRPAHEPTAEAVGELAELLTRSGTGAPRLPAGVSRERLQHALETGFTPARRASIEFTQPMDELAQGFERERIVADPAATRQALAREVSQLLDKREGTLSMRDLRRLGAIATLPDELRPFLPPPLLEAWPMQRWTNHPVHVRSTNVEHAYARQVLRERQAILDDPATSRAAIADEWRQLVTMDDARVEPHHVQRLGVISTLPDELRPYSPEPWSEAHGLLRQAWRREVPSTNVEAARARDNLRITLEHDRLVADPSTTRDALSGELRGMFARGVEHLTKEDLWRVGLLASLPDHLRPPSEFRGIRLINRFAKDPASDAHAAAALERIRGELAAASPTVVEDAAALLRDGIDPGPAVRLKLLERSPDELTAAGIDYQQLLRAALPKLERSQDLATFRAIVDRLGAGESAAEQQMLDAARSLIEQAGTKIYVTGHPDYAMLGRARANVELAMSLRAANALERQRPMPGAVAEVLAW